MARILVKDLVPGTEYAVQVRAVNGNDVSPWSHTIRFTTTIDEIGPKAVTGLTPATTSGTYSLTWTKPTQNTDNTALRDFGHYRVTVSSGATSRDFIVQQERFDLDLFLNRAVFGSPQGTVTMTVYAVDVNGNSSPPATNTFTNSPPANVTGLTVTPGPDIIDLSWTDNTDDDLSHYKVWRGTTTTFSSATAIGTTRNAFFAYNTTDYSTEYHYFVKAVDVFGTESATAARFGPVKPKNVFQVDTVAPPDPTNLSPSAFRVENNEIVVDLTWSPVSAADLAGYQVRYSTYKDATPTVRQWLYVNVPSDATETTLRGLEPNTKYIFEVRAVDFLANPSGRAVSTTTVTTPDAQVNTALVVESPGIIRSNNYNSGVSGWQLSSSGLDVATGSIYASAIRLQNSPNIAHPNYSIFPGNAPVFATGGTASGSSATISTTIYKFGSQTVLLTSTTTAAAATTFYFGTSNADLNTPTEAGRNYIVSMWVYPTAAGTVNIGLRRAGTVGGALGNSGADAKRVLDDSTTLVANTWQQVYVTRDNMPTDNSLPYITLTNPMNAYIDGIMVEERITAELRPSAYKPPGVTTIDGSVIKTGTIQSTANATEGDTTQPAWSISTSGAAVFGNAQVRGALVVGASGATTANVTTWVRSWNYSSGSTGWAIRGDGYAEFRNVTVKGEIRADSGSIDGTLMVGGRLEVGNQGAGNVDSYVIVRKIGDTGTWGMLDGRNNNWFLNTSSGAFRVDTDGNLTATSATITGNVTATSGTFTGTVNASGGSITGNLEVTGSLYMLGTGGTITSGARLRVMSTGIYAYNSSGTNTFYVTRLGAVYARSADIGGTIYADAGSISGDFSLTGGIFSVSGGTIRAGSIGNSTGRVEISNSGLKMIYRSSTGTDATVVDMGLTSNTVTFGNVNMTGSLRLQTDDTIWFGSTNNEGLRYLASSAITTIGGQSTGTANFKVWQLEYGNAQFLSSSRSYKHSIKDAVPKNKAGAKADAAGLETIKALKIRKFKWRGPDGDARAYGDDQPYTTGLIADEVPPELYVEGIEPGTEAVNMTELTWGMVASLQTLSAQAEEQKAIIAELQKEIARLSPRPGKT